MAENRLSIAELYERNRSQLSLSWCSGTLEKEIDASKTGMSPVEIIGHVNLIHPNRIQVAGLPEIRWLHDLSPERARSHLLDMVKADCPAIIVADGCDVSPLLRDICEQSQTALFTTPFPVSVVIDVLRSYAWRSLAKSETRLGVFMDVLGLGVLITGVSGVGKSELALELISRGHGIVADDVVEFARISHESIEGRCPPLIQDFLEVRGLGLINIRTIFGETASRRKMNLRLIVELHQDHQRANEQQNRLPASQHLENVLGIPVKKVMLPVTAGRNLAVLLEIAVRVTILELRGIDSMAEFIKRQKEAIENQSK